MGNARSLLAPRVFRAPTNRIRMHKLARFFVRGSCFNEASVENLVDAAACLCLCKNLLMMLTGSIGNSSFELYIPYTGAISTKPAPPYVHNCKQQVWLLPGGIPCSKLVLQTSNSAVAGLPILTAVLPSSCRLKYSKFSEREQSAQVRISVNPHMAHSTLSSSTSWFKGSSLPTVTVAGTLKPTLLYPYAIATSCSRSSSLRLLLPD